MRPGRVADTPFHPLLRRGRAGACRTVSVGCAPAARLAERQPAGEAVGTGGGGAPGTPGAAGTVVGGIGGCVGGGGGGPGTRRACGRQSLGPPLVPAVNALIL